MQVYLDASISPTDMSATEEEIYKSLQKQISKIAHDLQFQEAIQLKVAPLEVRESFNPKDHGQLICNAGNEIVVPYTLIKALNAAKYETLIGSLTAWENFNDLHKADPIKGVLEISDDERAMLAIFTDRAWSKFVKACPDDPNQLQTYLSALKVEELGFQATCGCLAHFTGAWVSEDECRAMLVHQVADVANRVTSQQQTALYGSREAIGGAALACMMSVVLNQNLFSWITPVLGIIAFVAIRKGRQLRDWAQFSKQQLERAWKVESTIARYPELVPVQKMLIKKWVVIENLAEISKAKVRVPPQKKAQATIRGPAIDAIYKSVTGWFSHPSAIQLTPLQRWKFWQSNIRTSVCK